MSLSCQMDTFEQQGNEKGAIFIHISAIRHCNITGSVETCHLIRPLSPEWLNSLLNNLNNPTPILQKQNSLCFPPQCVLALPTKHTGVLVGNFLIAE